MTRLGFIIVMILATGIIFYTGQNNPSVVGVEKSKGPWKFLHCTSTNNDCGRLE